MNPSFEAMAHTLAMEVRDYPEWHKGRDTYAAWMIDIDNRFLLEEIHRARLFFADFLLKPFDRQPHITLFVCGFVASEKKHDDDYCLAEQTGQIKQLNESKLQPFSLSLGKINSFASALYFEVYDASDSITHIRTVLANTMPELRWQAYVPHITIGLYNDNYPVAEIVDRVKHYQPAIDISVSVNQIKLMTYPAQVLVGPLKERYTHTL